MNEHDTVVPSSRRVVGLLFPVEVVSPGRGVVGFVFTRLMLVGFCFPRLGPVRVLCCGSPSGVTLYIDSWMVMSTGFVSPAHHGGDNSG